MAKNATSQTPDGVEIHSNRYCPGFTPDSLFTLRPAYAASRLLVRCKCMYYFSHNQTFCKINSEWPAMMGVSAERRFRTDAFCQAKLFSSNIFHNSRLFVNIVPGLRCPVSTTSLLDEKGTPVWIRDYTRSCKFLDAPCILNGHCPIGVGRSHGGNESEDLPFSVFRCFREIGRRRLNLHYHYRDFHLQHSR